MLNVHPRRLVYIACSTDSSTSCENARTIRGLHVESGTVQLEPEVPSDKLNLPAEP